MSIECGPLGGLALPLAIFVGLVGVYACAWWIELALFIARASKQELNAARVRVGKGEGRVRTGLLLRPMSTQTTQEGALMCNRALIIQPSATPDVEP